MEEWYYEGMNDVNYRDLLKFFDELGYKLTVNDKISLKELLNTLDDRRIFFEIEAHHNLKKYQVCFFLVRPKYSTHFILRECNFTKTENDIKISQAFVFNYEDGWMADRLADPITLQKGAKLMEGRPVFFEAQDRWHEIDFSHKFESSDQFPYNIRAFDRNWGFKRYPNFDIKERFRHHGLSYSKEVERELRNGEIIEVRSKKGLITIGADPAKKDLKITQVGLELPGNKRKSKRNKSRRM